MLSNNIKKLLYQVWCSRTHTFKIDIINQTLTKNNEIDKVLSNLPTNNNSNTIVVCLNINLLRNTFNDLRHITNGSIYILWIAETKTDASFPFAQVALDDTI